MEIIRWLAVSLDTYLGELPCSRLGLFVVKIVLFSSSVHPVVEELKSDLRGADWLGMRGHL